MRKVKIKEFKFKEYGDQLRFDYCPICKSEENNPDFSLNRHTGEFYCHRTGNGGHFKSLKKFDEDFYNYVQFLLRIEKKEAKNMKKRELSMNYDSLVKSKRQEFLNSDWIEYLKGRKIGEKYLNRLFRMGKNNTMMIPITSGKHVVAVKYRGLNKEMSCEIGSQSEYFINWQHIKTRDYLIIVEGEIDLLSSLEVGYENTVSLPFGALNIKAVKNQKDWIKEFGKIIIAVDNDKAGAEAFIKITKELGEIKERLYFVEMGKYKDFNEVLMAEGEEKLKEIVKNAKKLSVDSQDLFYERENGYCIKEKGIFVPLTNFTLDIKGYSDRFIIGVAHTLGRDKEFQATKTELLSVSGIVQHMGYYFGTPNSIPNFWSWILENNIDKYLGEIEHFGIIDDTYYDKTSNVVCDKHDLVIQNISDIGEMTEEERVWLEKNLLFMRNDPVQSLMGITWALGRMYNLNSYPILELAGSTSVGKTEYAEFITRILFGSKENIKSLGTLSIHQIRSLSSCSNITPWVMDEVKLIGKIIKEKTDYLAGTIRSIYDNKTVNQGNTKNKLYEFKLCTPVIISGESKLNDVSIRNRLIPVDLKASNKGDEKLYEVFKKTDILEKLGKVALQNRLRDKEIKIDKSKLKKLFPDVKDERQFYNISCLYIGLQALKKIIKIKKSIEKQFVEHLNKVGKEGRDVVKNFFELLEMVAESDKPVRTFYTVTNDGRHFLWFNMLYKAIFEEHLKTNSTLELIDMASLKHQLIDAGFIINDRVSVRFHLDGFSSKNKVVTAVEIKPIDVFKE